MLLQVLRQPAGTSLPESRELGFLRTEHLNSPWAEAPDLAIV
jgi:hypothetical protein